MAGFIGYSGGLVPPFFEPINKRPRADATRPRAADRKGCQHMNATRWTRPRRAARPRPFVRLSPALPSMARLDEALTAAVRTWVGMQAVTR